ncbi:uncharacterized protein LOC107262742 [Cephus cinctus]|uniref:Mitochondrial assembly of ribosomal large subunit protein 1 n=1 Tax=Cephus cinctus TaxID=211228 RepID=A0AAJ7BFD3_CEPCN|nr:uncharacterized protein LOC107262742 [Cephus cinctus]
MYLYAVKMCSRVARTLLQTGKVFYQSSYYRTTNLLQYSRVSHVRLYSSNNIHKKLTDEEISEDNNEEHNLPTGIAEKYKVFRDEDAEIIFDVDEEKKRITLEELNTEIETVDPYNGLNMNHGVNGVFDIEDLVELLKRDNAKNIFVATVPAELAYVDYLVVVNARSQKHMNALANFVRKAYKLKRHKTDQIPKVEGANSKDWLALDLGNIALHIFSSEARELYDLDTLWAVGPEFDDKTHEVNPREKIYEQYNEFLNDLLPADSR